MHPRSLAALAALSLLASGLWSGGAVAAPADVRVRVEGLRETIIDRVVRTDGHAIQAASDTASRRCDGTNAGRHPGPGPTSTAAAVDALSLRNLDFDGQWNAGFDDYFITRLGPEREDLVSMHQWAIVRNGDAQGVGGCQQRLTSGDEVLFANGGHGGRPLLWLQAPATPVAVGAPVSLTVRQGAPGTAPGSRTLATGAWLEAVDGEGLRLPLQPAGTASDGNGQASVTFTSPGWHRLKARMPSSGSFPPNAIASAAVAVCATAPGAAGCTGLPPGEDPQAPVTPAPPAPPVEPQLPPAPPQQAPVPELSAPTLLAGYAKRRQFAVSWKITAAGVGVRSWVVASRAAGSDGAWAQRAAGQGAVTRAAFRLPAGVRSALQLRVTDAAGRVMAFAAGSALTPIDERAKQVRRGGRWRSVRDGAAWNARYAVGRRGAWLRVKLAAGRPTLMVRGVRRAARVELRAGGRRQLLRIKGSATKATRELKFGRAIKAGTVRLKVLSGSVGVDGVAAD